MEKFQIPKEQLFNFFTDRMPSWSGWQASLVVDVTGKTTGEDGTSKSISNDIDLQLLLALRAKSSVIVTTGETARKEKYRASRFAPIAFITRDPESLNDVPAIASPGGFENIHPEMKSGELSMSNVGEQLRIKGFASFLFEGGPTSLSALLSSREEVRLVLSIVGNSNGNDEKLSDINPSQLLAAVLPSIENLDLLDDFQVGQNRITSWSKRSL